MDRGFFTNINSQLEGDIEIDFLDIRKVQLITDKVRRLLQILHLNATVVEQMERSIGRIKKYSPNLNATFEALESTMEMFILQHRTHSSRLQTMVDRAQGISGLVSDPAARKRER